MFDYKMMFLNNEDAYSASVESSKVLDLGQENPDLGMYEGPTLHVTAYPTKAYEGGTSPTIQLQVLHSANNSDFTECASSPVIKSTDGKFDFLDVPLPISHERYLKVKIVNTGDPTAGKLTVGITDGTQKNPFYKREI